MLVQKFTLPVGQELIAGVKISRDKTDKRVPQVVYIHGGGVNSAKERVYDIAAPLLEHATITSFDCSGHGESTGELKKGSLKKRTVEALEVIQKYAKEPLVLVGASMGGYIALRLLDCIRIDTLILMCPALYDGQAFEMRFDEGFTTIIRAHESWKNTDILDCLRAFTGKLLVIIGDRDEVIPSGVIDLIMNNAVNVRRKELYRIPDCPHNINTWLKEYPDELSKMQAKIGEFIAP